jgi:Uracil DNA glycosylase superfamily
MSRLSSLLQDAALGKHSLCASCVWNPSRVGKMAFGTSCPEHTHVSEGPALVVSIAQDPGGTTPESTSRLCVVHNSQNPTDQSAIHAFDLWRAAISFQPQTHPYSDPYMKRTYFTNALLHGVPTRDGRKAEERKRLQGARRTALTSCARVLEAQLSILRPKIVMVSGESAIQALGSVAPGDWSEATDEAPARRVISMEGVPHRILAFRLIHAGAQGTNLAAAPTARRLFRSAAEQEAALRARIGFLPSPQQALNFLDRYRDNGTTDTTFRGMMLHLRWWITVGEAIRAAALSN